MEKPILIKNGNVIDPFRKGIQKKDIAIKNGIFVSLEELINSKSKILTIDASDCYVSPGFIDMHVHVFTDYTELGIEPDKIGIEQGVTTIVDAGSTGSEDFPRFKEMVIDKSKTEILTFLNISKKGLCHGLSELAELRNLMTYNEFKEVNTEGSGIVGIKARISSSVVKESGILPLIYARGMADATGLPIMTHIGNPPPNLQEIFPLLRKGDIVTHAFHGKKNGILNERGEMLKEALEGLERGVLFDVGHGTNSFSYKTLMKYKENYDYPFTISTDIYIKNYAEPVGSLMQTMSKLVQLGYSLEELVKSVTIRVKENLNLREQGTFDINTCADVTLFKLTDKKQDLMDSQGELIKVDQMIVPYMTLREGKVVFTNDTH